MEAIGSKALFLILWVCVAVSPCFGYYSYRSYRSYRSGYGSGYYYSTSTAKLKGWHYGLIIGVTVVICGIIFLYAFCKMKKRGESRGNDIGLEPVEPNVDQTQEPPTYPTTEMTYNTKDALNNLSPDGFTTQYPDTSNSCPPQPYPFNNGTAPYPTDGANPATMGIVRPPQYEPKTAYANYGLVK